MPAIQRVWLTKLEADILLHRLEVPDAIADAMDRLEPETEYEAVALACERLAKQLRSGYVEPHDKLERAVLEDAFVGSTYVACMEEAYHDGQLSAQKLGKIKRAYERLGDKLAAEVGLNTAWQTY